MKITEEIASLSIDAHNAKTGIYPMLLQMTGILFDLIRRHKIFMYIGNKSLALRFNQVYDCLGYMAHLRHYLDFHPDLPATARKNFNEQFNRSECDL